MVVLRLCIRRRLGRATAIVSAAVAVYVCGVALGPMLYLLCDGLWLSHSPRLVTLVASDGISPNRRGFKASEVRVLRSLGWPVLDVGTVERWPYSARGIAQATDGVTVSHPLVAYATRNVLEMSGASLPVSTKPTDEAVVAMVTASFARAMSLEGGQKQLRVDDMWTTVVGVLPSGFDAPLPTLPSEYLYDDRKIQVWIVSQEEDVEAHYYTPVLSVDPGASLRGLSREIDRRMGLITSGKTPHITFRVEPLRLSRLEGYGPMFAGVIVTCAAIVALALVNLIAALLMRIDERRKEFGIQAMLGASAGRLWWAHVCDACVMVCVATILGAGFAGVVALDLPEDVFPVTWAPSGIWHVGTAAMTGVAVLFMSLGVVSCVFARRWTSGVYLTTADVGANARALGSVSSRSRWALAVLVSCISMGVAPVLALDLAFTGLADRRPFLTAQHTLILQFRASEIWSARLGGLERLYAEVRREVMSLSGVQEVGFASDAPLLNAGGENWIVHTPGGSRTRVFGLAADSEFLRGMGVKLRSGRLFDERDPAGGAPLALLSESLAQRLFGTNDVVGRRVAWHGSREIIGVIEDVRLGRSGDRTDIMYVPLSQEPARRIAALVRFIGAREMEAAREHLKAVGPWQPVDSVVSTAELGDVAFGKQRAYIRLAGLFAAAGVVLGGIGLNLIAGYVCKRRRVAVAIKRALGMSMGRLATEDARAYGRELVWGMIGAVPAAVVVITLLKNAMAPLQVPILVPCVLTAACVVLVSWVAAVVHSVVSVGMMKGVGLSARMSEE